MPAGARSQEGIGGVGATADAACTPGAGPRAFAGRVAAWTPGAGPRASAGRVAENRSGADPTSDSVGEDFSGRASSPASPGGALDLESGMSDLELDSADSAASPGSS